MPSIIFMCSLAAAVLSAGFSRAATRNRAARVAQPTNAVAPLTRCEIDSDSISFGNLIPGERRVLPAALRMRVFSAQPWRLHLIPICPSMARSTALPVPISRLHWRSAGGEFVPFRTAVPALVAYGGPTGAAGRAVDIDYELELADTDPAEQYRCEFEILLDDARAINNIMTLQHR
jgi:hypothetical protein